MASANLAVILARFDFIRCNLTSNFQCLLARVGDIHRRPVPSILHVVERAPCLRCSIKKEP